MPDTSASFDHLIHWVDDLDSAMAGYQRIGLPTTAALTMPGFRNGAWPIDDERYIELATVEDWAAVSASVYAEGLEILKPGIEALAGPGLLTFAVDVPDANAVAAKLRAAGRDVAVTEVFLEERGAGFVEVFARDVPSYFPFFITYQPPRRELARLRAEHRQTHGLPAPDQSLNLTALLAQSPDPDGEAARLAEFIGCPATGAVVELPGAEIRIELGDRSGLTGIVVSGLDPAHLPASLYGMAVRCESDEPSPDGPQ